MTYPKKSDKLVFFTEMKDILEKRQKTYTQAAAQILPSTNAS